jgi:hypothetical protein
MLACQHWVEAAGVKMMMLASSRDDYLAEQMRAGDSVQGTLRERKV